MSELTNNAGGMYNDAQAQYAIEKPELGLPPVFPEELNCNHKCGHCGLTFNRVYQHFRTAQSWMTRAIQAEQQLAQRDEQIAGLKQQIAALKETLYHKPPEFFASRVEARAAAEAFKAEGREQGIRECVAVVDDKLTVEDIEDWDAANTRDAALQYLKGRAIARYSASEHMKALLMQEPAQPLPMTLRLPSWKRKPMRPG